MNIALLLVYYLGTLFHIWLVWTFYHVYLAAWSKEGAKESWVAIMETPLGVTFKPFFKWGGLFLLFGGSVNLILIFMLTISKTVIFFSGGSIAT